MPHHHPGHLFAFALFSAVGLSHTLRPAIWKAYVAHLVSQGHAGVVIYASFHALPGAMLIALAGTHDWTGVVLTLARGSLALKATLYTLFPDRALRSMARGLDLPTAAWSLAGAAFLSLALVAAWGLWTSVASATAASAPTGSPM